MKGHQSLDKGQNIESSLTDSEIVLLSHLNDFTFCSRRLALHYIEGIWSDNAHTIVGTFLHNQVDRSGCEMDGDIKLLRALPLFSNKFGLVGKSDIVEMHGDQPIPVEYKKGKRKQWSNDDIQLCAQALCLEEMLQTPVPKGFIYHAGSKRRREVVFDESLRNATLKAIEEVRVMLKAGVTPKAELKPQCDGCSLHELCLPELTDLSRTNRIDRNALWKVE